MTKQRIIVRNARLDRIPNGDTFLRGVIDPVSLSLLQVGSYQREAIGVREPEDLKAAYLAGDVQDIELGVRGSVDDVEKIGDGVFAISDEVYIVDGQQRVMIAREMVGRNKRDPQPHVGAILRFSSTEEIERRHFDIYNFRRMRIAPNVRYRNARFDNAGIAVLYALAYDKKFALANRVSWEQKKSRKDLLQASGYISVIAQLHRHIIPGSKRGSDALLVAMHTLAERIGKEGLAVNTYRFFEVVDSAWGVRNVILNKDRPHLNVHFLEALGIFFSDHINFWVEHRLVVTQKDEKKLASFPINDPDVARLAGSSSAIVTMCDYLAQHINQRRKQKQWVVSRRLRFADDEVRNGEE